MAGTRKKFNAPNERVHELFDYICLRQPLTYTSGSTSKLVRREPDDPTHWWIIEKMFKQDNLFQLEKDTRWCPHCGETRPKRLFGQDQTNWDGVRGWCKPCVAAEEKRRYWLKRDSDEMWEAWHRRHVLRLANDTESEQAA